MKRKLIEQLENWSDSLQKKPLILTGAKGTGKTYLALAFANTFYDSYVYWNFENDPVNLEDFLQAGKADLAAFFTCILTKGKSEVPLDNNGTAGSHVFVLDEITCLQGFETLIGLLKEQFPAADILAISSTEPVFSETEAKAYHLLRLYPMDFEEFLIATGNEWYIEVIKEQYRSGNSIPEIVHKELLELLEDYLYVGGLPLAVNEYVTNGCRENIPELHKNILFSYLFDAGMKKGDSCALKVKQILYSLPVQLSKRNKKFQYTLLRKGATEALYLEGHSYIRNTSIGIYNRKITDEEIEGRRQDTADGQKNPGTKIYLFDVGLYHSLSRLAGIRNEKEFREGLLEAYTAQALNTAGIDFGYWESDSMSYSLFLLKSRQGFKLHLPDTNLAVSGFNQSLLPLEVRETGGNRSKGLSSFHEKHPAVQGAVKITSGNKAVNKSKGDKLYLPLYGIFCLDL